MQSKNKGHTYNLQFGTIHKNNNTYTNANNHPSVASAVVENDSHKLPPVTKSINLPNTYSVRLVDKVSTIESSNNPINLAMLLAGNNDESIVNNNDKTEKIYFTEYGKNQLIACNIVKKQHNQAIEDGLTYDLPLPDKLTNCKVILSKLNEPENLLIENNMLYIANYGDTSILECKLNQYGNILNCNKTRLRFNPVYILATNDDQIAVTNFPEKHMLKLASCRLYFNGSIDNCDNVSVINEDLLPTKLTNGYTYLPDYSNNAVKKCLNTGCRSLTQLGFNHPLSVYVTKDMAYVTTSDSLFGCGVEQQSGDLFGCKILAVGLDSAYGVAAYASVHATSE